MAAVIGHAADRW